MVLDGGLQIPIITLQQLFALCHIVYTSQVLKLNQFFSLIWGDVFLLHCSNKLGVYGDDCRQWRQDEFYFTYGSVISVNHYLIEKRDSWNNCVSFI